MQSIINEQFVAVLRSPCFVCCLSISYERLGVRLITYVLQMNDDDDDDDFSSLLDGHS